MLAVGAMNSPSNIYEVLGGSLKGTGVEFVHPSLMDILPDYKTINDCLSGARHIKEQKELYLPRPNPTDRSAENNARYKDYLMRAVFYGVTRYTLNALVGTIFMRSPQAEVPPSVDKLVEDATGDGVSLEQLAMQACGYTLSKGRAGILSNFPNVEDTISVAQLASDEIRPVLAVYPPEQIVNWRTVTVNEKRVVSLVVLLEWYQVGGDDGFSFTYERQYRVLSLVDGVYHHAMYRKTAQGAYAKEWDVIPTKANGEPFDYITFQFIGVDKNDADVSYPPMLDMAELNIGHYRNSADQEDASFTAGQPTPWVSGLTENWLKQIGGKTFQLGSRTAFALPMGGEAGMIQAEANTIPRDGMEHKEKQMVALGARLVEQRTSQRTATEANQDKAAETSTLSRVAQNVSNAFKFAIIAASAFIDAEPDEESVNYQLNTEFDLNQLTSDELRQTIDTWQKGAITFSEMRETVRRGGYASLDDDAAREAIDKEEADRLTKEIEQTRAMNEAMGLDAAENDDA